MVHLPSWSLYLVAKDTNAALAPWCLPSERPIPRQAPLVRLLTAVGCEPGPAPAPAPGSTPVPPGFRAVNPVVVTATAAMLSLQCVQQCLCQQLETLEATRRTQLQHKWRRSVLAAKRRVSLGDINLIRDTQRCVEDTVAVLARAAAPALGPVLAREWGIGRAGAPAAAGAGAGAGAGAAGAWTEFDWSGYFGAPDPGLTMGVCVKHTPKWARGPMVQPVAMPLVWGPQSGPGPGPYLNLANVCAAAASVARVSSMKLAAAMAAGGVGPGTTTPTGLWPLLRMAQLADAMAPMGVTLVCDMVSTLAAAAGVAPPVELAVAVGTLVQQDPSLHHAAFFVALTARFQPGKPLGPWARPEVAAAAAAATAAAAAAAAAPPPVPVPVPPEPDLAWKAPWEDLVVADW